MAVTRDTDAMYTSASFPSSPSTTSFTVASQSNRVLVVWFNWLRNGTEISTAPTYGGVSLTHVANYVMTSGPYGSLWYLIAPATGANNLVVTHNGSTFTAFIGSYYGVDQTTPLGTPSSDVAFGPATSTSLSPASAVGDLIVGFLNKNGGTALAATGTGATLRQSGNDADLDGIAGFADQTAAASSTTGGFSWTTNAGGVHVRVAIKQISGGTNVNLTGQEATSELGTLSYSKTLGLTGQEATAEQGSPTVNAGSSVSVNLVGQEALTEQGTFTLAWTIPLVGLEVVTEMPTSYGIDLTTSDLAGLEVTTEQGTLSQGTSSNNVSLIGQEILTELGTLVVNHGISGFIGQELTAELGVLAANIPPPAFTPGGQTFFFRTRDL